VKISHFCRVNARVRLGEREREGVCLY
jgi:hypothetical protein